MPTDGAFALCRKYKPMFSKTDENSDICRTVAYEIRFSRVQNKRSISTIDRTAL